MRVPLERYPGMNRLVLDWLNGDERFLRRATTRETQPTPKPSFGREPLADALDRSNRQWGIFAKDALRRWATGETLTIVAGQQVGFAGGPLYTLAKLATLVRLKRDLEKQGLPVTLFFWLATEDHDFDEVATLNVPVASLATDRNVNRQVDLVCMRAVRAADPKAVVGSLPVPELLIEQLLALFDIPRPNWLRPGITFRDSFAELIVTLFGSEIVLVDALLPELRRAGAALFGHIHARQDEIQRVLHDRALELEKAGYHEQVIPRDGDAYTLLFEIDDKGARRCVTHTTAPERTSTSALTRPLLQDFVLQPDIFVGGPAEVAYYAQIAPLHDLLGVRMPRVALRGHALVLPRRQARAVERYAIDIADVFRSPDALLAEREPEGVARIRTVAQEARRDLIAKMEEIAELGLPAEHSLATKIERSIGHIEYHFDKLAERAIKGLVRKDRERYAATRELVTALYPDRHVQDRVVSWFAWYCRYGEGLVDALVDEIEPDSAFFKVVTL